MTLRLVEMHRLYPLFAMHDVATTPILEAGRLYALSWTSGDERLFATAVCEDRAGEGLFFRIPRATDFEGARGITGPSLAAVLFSKNEAALAATDVCVSFFDLGSEAQDQSVMVQKGPISCSSIW